MHVDGRSGERYLNDIHPGIRKGCPQGQPFFLFRGLVPVWRKEMFFAPYSLIVFATFAAYVAAAICWQQTRPAPVQTGRRATVQEWSASPTPTSRLYTNR